MCDNFQYSFILKFSLTDNMQTVIISYGLAAEFHIFLRRSAIIRTPTMGVHKMQHSEVVGILWRSFICILSRYIRNMADMGSNFQSLFIISFNCPPFVCKNSQNILEKVVYRFTPHNVSNVVFEEPVVCEGKNTYFFIFAFNIRLQCRCNNIICQSKHQRVIGGFHIISKNLPQMKCSRINFYYRIQQRFFRIQRGPQQILSNSACWLSKFHK